MKVGPGGREGGGEGGEREGGGRKRCNKRPKNIKVLLSLLFQIKINTCYLSIRITPQFVPFSPNTLPSNNKDFILCGHHGLTAKRNRTRNSRLAQHLSPFECVLEQLSFFSPQACYFEAGSTELYCYPMKSVCLICPLPVVRVTDGGR